MATPDGRLAVWACEGGVTHLVDLAGRKPLADFGAANGVAKAVAINPQGTEVLFVDQGGGNFGSNQLKRYDVKSGTISALYDDGEPTYLAYSADGKTVVESNGAQVFVKDAANLRRRFSLLTNMREFQLADAVSPDGNWVVCGSGEWFSAGAWAQGRLNQVSLFSLAHAGQAPVGPEAGSVSWEQVPLRVHTIKGAVVPLDEWEFPPGNTHSPMFSPVMVRLGDHLDGMCLSGAVLLHRDAGILEEVLENPDAGFA